MNTITQMDMQFPNQISLVALDDSRHFEEEFTRPFRNISLLPVLLAEQVFSEPHHMLRYEEYRQQQQQQQRTSGQLHETTQQQGEQQKKQQIQPEKKESRATA